MVEWFLVKNIVLKIISVLLLFYVEVCVLKINRAKQKLLIFSKILSSGDVFSITTQCWETVTIGLTKRMREEQENGQ